MFLPRPDIPVIVRMHSLLKATQIFIPDTYYVYNVSSSHRVYYISKADFGKPGYRERPLAYESEPSKALLRTSQQIRSHLFGENTNT